MLNRNKPRQSDGSSSNAATLLLCCPSGSDCVLLLLIAVHSFLQFPCDRLLAPSIHRPPPPPPTHPQSVNAQSTISVCCFPDPLVTSMCRWIHDCSSKTVQPRALDHIQCRTRTNQNVTVDRDVPTAPPKPLTLTHQHVQ